MVKTTMNEYDALPLIRVINGLQKLYKEENSGTGNRISTSAVGEDAQQRHSKSLF